MNLQNISLSDRPTTCTYFKNIWPIATKVSTFVLSFLKKHSFAIAIGFFVAHSYYTKITGESSIKEKTVTSLIYGFVTAASCTSLYILYSKTNTLTRPYFKHFFPYVAIPLEILLLARLTFVILFTS